MSNDLFKMLIEANLPEPLAVQDENGDPEFVEAFFQTFGVVANGDAEAIHLAAHSMPENMIVNSEVEIWPLAEFAGTIGSTSYNLETTGIIFKTGRALYPSKPSGSTS